MKIDPGRIGSDPLGFSARFLGVMSVVFLLVGMVVVVSAALVAAGRMGELPPIPLDRAGVGLPSGGVSPDDIRRLRFPVGLRGYRMLDVDRALARLQAELADRDALLANSGCSAIAVDPGHRGYSDEHRAT
ncbi:MAG: DivIVA domain-containing protein [Candidatus Nanopelagicales bacterium]|nr:DivIVA domain-containing protein [Candidatus Nanopelagicales bacterium]